MGKMLSSIGIGRRARQKLKLVFTHVILIIVVSLVALPFIWMVSSSFKGLGEIITKTPRIIPLRPTLEGYREVFSEPSFLSSLLNTLFVTTLTVIFSMLIAFLSAYALSRFRFKGNSEITIGIVASRMIPAISTIIPLFVIFRNYHLINNLWGLIIAYTTFTLPFCIWMLKGYFDSIPSELEEAAQVDGCSEFGSMWRVLIPVASPGIAVVGVFAFAGAWAELMLARALLSSERNYTLAVWISTYALVDVTIWPMLLALSLLITTPLCLFFFSVQRYMVTGLTAGAVKG